MNVFWGVARPFHFEEYPRLRSRLAVMRGLANTLTLSQKVEGDGSSWTEETDCPLFTPSGVWLQIYKSFANPVLSCITQSVKQHYSEVIEEIGTMYACARSKTKRKC